MKMTPFISISLLFAVGSCIAEQENFLPAKLSPVTLEGANSGACPSSEVTEAARNSQREEIQSILRDTVTPALDIQQPCPCGGPGKWRKIAHLNMSGPGQQCPPNWRLITAPERACARSSGGSSCDSATYSSGGRSYSRVCGRVIAYQRGSPSAFEPTIANNRGLEDVYLEGVSLTHGAAGSRQHIWSFANALFENDPSYNSYRDHVCQCINTNADWPYQLPSFIGTDYFCDTGSPGPRWTSTAVYSDDPLWDGEGCGATNACCEFNTPPWFCTTLPESTSDDIELRICADQDPQDEDTYVRLVDIYTM